MDYLVAGVFLLLFAWAAGRWIYLHWWGERATGVIIKLLRDDSGETTMYTPMVEFTTRQGVTVIAESIFGTSEAGTYYRIGQRVDIRYAPRKPTCCAISGYEAASVLYLFLAAVFVLAVLGWHKLGLTP